VFLDLRHAVAGSTVVETNVCVVGAGAAGIAIAREFAERPVDVVLLESGGLGREASVTDLNAGESVGLAYGPLETMRSRQFGGSTNCWGGWSRPLDPEDFEQRPWVRHSGWPFGQAELEPYYADASSLLRLGPMEYDARVWERRIGRPQARLLPLQGSRISSEINQFSPPARFGALYGDTLKNASNVRVILHASLLEIETDRGATRVTGLRVGSLGGKEIRVVPRIVVLAMGGIENARLLLLSNRLAPAGLGNDNDLVGRFFTDHPQMTLGRLRDGAEAPVDFYDASFTMPNRRFAAGGVSVAAFMMIRPEVRAQEGLLSSRMLFNSVFAGEESPGVASLRRLVRDGHGEEESRNKRRDVLTILRHADKVALTALGRRLLIHRLIRNRQVVAVLEPEPNPDSRVTLSRQRDALGLHRAKVDWRLTSLTRHSFVRSRQILAEEFKRYGLGTIQFDPDDDGADATGWTWHHIGTTRMSDDPKQGVVDRQCKVHGIENLYIAGTSVFPTAGSDMPTLTMVALALRLADYLASSVLGLARPGVRLRAGATRTTPTSRCTSAS
jgi:choline dehydrogenase-like flavoprotein